MARCFCGCGRQVGFGGRGMNKNGERTTDALVRLRDERGQLEERSPQGSLEADSAEWNAAVLEIDQLILDGSEYEGFWAAVVHGEDPPPPGEAITIKKEWVGWLRQSQKVAKSLETSRRSVDRLLIPTTEQGPIEDELLSAALNRSDDDSWGWTVDAGRVVAEFATAFSGGYRPAYNAVLDALALGYFLHEEEQETVDDTLTFGIENREKLKDLEGREGQAAALKLGAWSTAEEMPAPFTLGADSWESLVAMATEELRDRQRYFADETEEAPSIPDEDLRRAIGFGYGVGLTSLALEVAAVGDGEADREEVIAEVSLEELERKYGGPSSD